MECAPIARGGCDEISVVPRRLAVRQQRDVFQPGADAMPSLSTPRDSSNSQRATVAQAVRSSVSRPASSNAWTCTDRAPASTAARAASAMAVGLRGAAG